MKIWNIHMIDECERINHSRLKKKFSSKYSLNEYSGREVEDAQGRRGASKGWVPAYVLFVIFPLSIALSVLL